MRRYYLATHARRPSALVAAVLLVLGFPSSVGAVCNQKSASTAETDLWNTHQCWQDFFLYSYKAYDQRSSDWAGRGWDDACNVNLEFPKHWNAAYLLTYGLVDENCCSFHGTKDYMSTALSYSSQFHDALYHSIRDRTDLFGAFIPTS